MFYCFSYQQLLTGGRLATLPDDIKREIVEIVAYIRPRDAVRLTWVSREVQRWYVILQVPHSHQNHCLLGSNRSSTALSTSTASSASKTGPYPPSKSSSARSSLGQPASLPSM